MIQTVAEHPGFTLAVISLCGVVLGYFLRKVLSSIDSHAEMINALKMDLAVQLANSRADLKEDIASVFNDTCSERQGSCSRLQQAKLDTLQATHQAICAKIGRIDLERKEAWAEQRRWNDKLEEKVYRRNGSIGK